MDKKKVLIVTHEMDPYLMMSSAAEFVHSLPKPIQDQELDVRILMPRFGTINERRHKLHEVVRLSGINIVVNNEDYPLIIKVASLPSIRLQVYFLDNEEFFSRKSVFTSENEQMHEDNTERMVFFAQGVLETVKKFGWPPNVIHINGWFSSLIPLYLKKVYQDEPVFNRTKIVYSAYDEEFGGDLGADFQEKAVIDSVLQPADFAVYNQGDYESLNKGAMTYADAITIGSKVKGDYSSIDKEHVLDGEQTPESIIELYTKLIEVE